MSIGTDKHKRKRLVIIASIVLVLAVFVSICAIYLGDYYHADMDSIEAFAPMKEVTVSTLDDGKLIFEPNQPWPVSSSIPAAKWNIRRTRL